MRECKCTLLLPLSVSPSISKFKQSDTWKTHWHLHNAKPPTAGAQMAPLRQQCEQHTWDTVEEKQRRQSWRQWGERVGIRAREEMFCNVCVTAEDRGCKYGIMWSFYSNKTIIALVLLTSTEFSFYWAEVCSPKQSPLFPRIQQTITENSRLQRLQYRF